MQRSLSLLAGIAITGVTLITVTVSAASGHEQSGARQSTGTAQAADTGTSGESKLPQLGPANTLRVVASPGGYTAWWTPFNGCADLYVPLPVSAAAPVAVSASERTTDGVEWMGAANVDVHNVRVISGGVQVRVCVNWGAPLPINTHYVWS